MTDAARRLILFARYPVPGLVKTRLIPALGAEGAASLHRRLVLRTLRAAHAACRAFDAEFELRYDGGHETANRHWLGIQGLCRPQKGGDLGERMANAFEDSFREGSTATIIIGSDCPGLTHEILVSAFKQLEGSPVVLGPASDGGYYLVGLARLIPELFRAVSWGSERVLGESIAILERIGVRAGLLPQLDDIDRPTDLPVWRRFVEREESGRPRISVVIPTLNEASGILSTLESVRRGNPQEIIVVDGGSTDETRSLAAGPGVTVISSRSGRAQQMNAGAGRASGDLLLFLHADTLLPLDWERIVSETVGNPGVVAGAFSFQIGASVRGRRIVEWAANCRSRWCPMPYGDQALFLRQATFEEEGGFADLPIMEDYEFVCRLRRRGRIITVPEAAVTSGRRWVRLGVMRATLYNQLTLAGYHLGVQPHRLAEFYRGRQ